MKIIADMGGGKFLVEADSIEIANVIGVNRPCAASAELINDRDLAAYKQSFRVGAVFSVSPAYKWISDFKARREEALRSTNIMRAFLDHVQSAVPEIAPPIVISPEDVKAAEAQS
jgi:hypothetical protein